MSEKQRFPLETALPIAEELCSMLAPACMRIEIAGSIRRRRSDVGDIELLCVPKQTIDSVFGTDDLDRVISSHIAVGLLDYRTDVRGRRTYGPMNKLLRHVPSGIPLDVFSTTAENFGMSWVVRTGPAEWNKRMMQRFRDIGFRAHAYGGVHNRQGVELDCPDEATVFRLMNLPYVEPWDRTDHGPGIPR